MFISKWVVRVGQIVAPDENYVPEPDEQDTQSGFWLKVAPLTPTEGTSAFQSPSPTLVQCEHCHKYTRTSNTSSSSTETPASATLLATPSFSRPTTATKSLPSSDVETRVLETARDLAKALVSPIQARKPELSVLEFCVNTALPTNAKAQKRHDKAHARVKTILQNNPRIFNAKASRMGNSPPDGFTPLMTAAFCGNLTAATLLLDLGPPEQLLYRSLQGKTAFHIASEM
jgi:hypothetical protein